VISIVVVNLAPCVWVAIYWARPARIFYAATREDAANAGFDDAFIYDELKVETSDRKIISQQLLRENANIVLQKWNTLDKKIPY